MHRERPHHSAVGRPQGGGAAEARGSAEALQVQGPEAQQRLYRYRVEGLKRPEVQQRLYRYRVERLQRPEVQQRLSTGTGSRDSKGLRL